MIGFSIKMLSIALLVLTLTAIYYEAALWSAFFAFLAGTTIELEMEV